MLWGTCPSAQEPTATEKFLFPFLSKQSVFLSLTMCPSSWHMRACHGVFHVTLLPFIILLVFCSHLLSHGQLKRRNIPCPSSSSLPPSSCEVNSLPALFFSQILIQLSLSFFLSLFLNSCINEMKNPTQNPRLPGTAAFVDFS